MGTPVMDPTMGNGKSQQVKKHIHPKGYRTVAGVTGAVLGASKAVIFYKITEELQAHGKH